MVKSTRFMVSNNVCAKAMASIFAAMPPAEFNPTLSPTIPPKPEVDGGNTSEACEPTAIFNAPAGNAKLT